MLPSHCKPTPQELKNATLLKPFSYNNVGSCLSSCPRGPQCLEKPNLLFTKHTNDEKYKMAASWEERGADRPGTYKNHVTPVFALHQNFRTETREKKC